MSARAGRADSVGGTGTAGGRRAVSSEQAPAAVGPYSQAVQLGGFVFCSGQIPLDPESGKMVHGGVGAQTARCLESLGAVCEAAGASLADAVRLTVYTTKLERFSEINEVYGGFFGEDPPARVTVGVAALPKGAEVEIDAIVAIREG